MPEVPRRGREGQGRLPARQPRGGVERWRPGTGRRRATGPSESLLLQAIRYEELEMPPGGKLPGGRAGGPDAAGSRDGLPWGSLPAADAPSLRRSAPSGRAAASASAIGGDRRVVAPAGRPPAGPGGEGPRTGAATRSTPSSWPGSRPSGSRPRPRPIASTLIRRLSFDLTGLPPTPEEVDAFVADRVARTPTSAWSTGCSTRPTTARTGAGTGSTWSATPRPTATSATRPSRSPGGIATT